MSYPIFRAGTFSLLSQGASCVLVPASKAVSVALALLPVALWTYSQLKPTRELSPQKRSRRRLRLKKVAEPPEEGKYVPYSAYNVSVQLRQIENPVAQQAVPVSPEPPRTPPALSTFVAPPQGSLPPLPLILPPPACPPQSACPAAPRALPPRITKRPGPVYPGSPNTARCWVDEEGTEDPDSQQGSYSGSDSGWHRSTEATYMMDFEDDDEPVFWISRYKGSITDAFSEYINTAPPGVMVRKPLQLKVYIHPSMFAEVLERRFNNLNLFLTSQSIRDVAHCIHSIDIAIPTCLPEWTFKSPCHPFDQKPVPCWFSDDECWDGMSWRRYKNEFPNLVAFKWSGWLGQRKGDNGCSGLPAPFYDLMSLPYHQLKSLDLIGCALSIPDCRYICRSSPQLEVFRADTICAVKGEPLGNKPVLHDNVFKFAGEGYDTSCLNPQIGNKDIICPRLKRLILTTSVDLKPFFATIDTPCLKFFGYRPLGQELGCITFENFPWNVSNWHTLEEVEVEAETISDEVDLEFQRLEEEHAPLNIGY